MPPDPDRSIDPREAQLSPIPLAQEQIGVMMSILKMRGQPVENFLDLGCGDGILGAAILGAYPSSRGVFVDFSEPMLEQAREQLERFAATGLQRIMLQDFLPRDLDMVGSIGRMVGP